MNSTREQWKIVLAMFVGAVLMGLGVALGVFAKCGAWRLFQ